MSPNEAATVPIDADSLRTGCSTAVPKYQRTPHPSILGQHQLSPNTDQDRELNGQIEVLRRLCSTATSNEKVLIQPAK